MGFTKHKIERYTERENYYYSAFKAIDSLTPKALPPTRSKGDQNLSDLCDQLIADAEADD